MEGKTTHQPAGIIYRQLQRLKKLYLLFFSLFVLGMFLFGLSMGSKHLSFSEIMAALFTPGNKTNHQIVFNLRLPRMIAALISGASLGLAGAVMQVILRNPLGSPFTLGISNAAAFGAAMAYIFTGSFLFKSIEITTGGHYLVITLSAFVWATIGALFIIFIARKKGATPENMILAGIIINTFFMALTSVLQFLADETQLGSIVFWTFGDLAKTSWTILLVQSVIIVPVFLYLLKNGNKYNALDSGDQIARNLGVNVQQFRMISIVLTSLLTAAIVSFYGIIAFVGLVIPHVVRIIFGSESRFLLMGSIVTGSGFLLLCDLISRSLFSPVVIPVGIITSVVGAPLFVFLLLKGSKRWSK